ncbi:DNA cytosine methyltransferase, partial [Brucella oryzae]|uniref:DNA cytosine methyltransferase n=1 Tax=Brucella oryzae TaxID=335286 RepID=UPI003CC92489
MFAGIGGAAIGRDRTGGRARVGPGEIEPSPRAVLRNSWPEGHQGEDIHAIERCDCEVICGGVPCQPFSTASRGRR